tara:strand:+ start:3069 stop:3545 length:477 start_codon:yes stop_codon:yes gene_type:complete
MSNKIKAQITETGDIDKLLSQLPHAMRQRAFPKALRAGARVVQKAEQSKLPDPGYEGDADPDVSLKKEIKIKLKHYEDHVIVIVGPTYRGAPHSYLVEFGHTITATEHVDGVAYVTTYHGAARPYVRQSIDETKGEQHSSVLASLRKDVKKLNRELMG